MVISLSGQRTDEIVETFLGSRRFVFDANTRLVIIEEAVPPRPLATLKLYLVESSSYSYRGSYSVAVTVVPFKW